MTFTKLFSTILESTVWCEPSPTRIVWITMLAIADRHGVVHAAVPGLANRAGVSVEDCETALTRFQQPDKYSRTPDNDGRRIEPIEGGWRLLNYLKYRELGNPVRASLDMDGYVYFAGVPGGDRIKIGFSKNPWARINDLRVTNPKLEILATEKATMAREKERHEEFKNIRVGGEWFTATATLLSLVAALSGRDGRSNASTTVVCKTTTVAADVEVDLEVEVEADSKTKVNPTVAPTRDAVNGRKKEFAKQAVEVIAFLNAKAAKNYQPVKANVDLVVGLLAGGVPADDIRAVVAKKCREWKGKPEMETYLRPATLFGPKNFHAKYHGEIPPAEAVS